MGTPTQGLKLPFCSRVPTRRTRLAVGSVPVAEAGGVPDAGEDALGDALGEAVPAGALGELDAPGAAVEVLAELLHAAKEKTMRTASTKGKSRITFFILLIPPYVRCDI